MLDVQRPVKGLVVHTVRVREGEVRAGADVLAQVDPEWRLGARQAHSGTHVVHAALREVLGPDALQSGSYNKPGYLRLDFSWNQALSAAARSEVEDVANRAIREDLGCQWQYMTLPEAKAWGAIALFGETYDEQVRVVEIGGPWSRELCGGTHVDHSSQIGLIALTGESSVGSGSRRVEALVGLEAFHHLARERALVATLTDSLKARPEELPDRVAVLAARLREAEKELRRSGRASARPRRATWPRPRSVAARRLVQRAGGVASATTCAASRWRCAAGWARTRPWSLSAAWPRSGRSCWSRRTPRRARRGWPRGALARTAAAALGGGGGGKADVAQGGGTDPSAAPRRALARCRDGGRLTRESGAARGRRRVGVDVGTVRVGVASSDPDGLLATPVETVPRGTGADGGVARIAEIVREHGAVVVYVGLPRHLSGREGSASEAARNYGVHLARAVAPVPVRLVDERMSTVSAHRRCRRPGGPGAASARSSTRRPRS